MMGGDWNLNESLIQALKLEAAKAAAGSPARLQGLTGAPSMENYPTERQREVRPVCWQCGSTGHLCRDCRQGSHEGDQDSRNE
jgi:hypothetical protein